MRHRFSSYIGEITLQINLTNAVGFCRFCSDVGQDSSDSGQVPRTHIMLGVSIDFTTFLGFSVHLHLCIQPLVLENKVEHVVTTIIVKDINAFFKIVSVFVVL